MMKVVIAGAGTAGTAAANELAGKAEVYLLNGEPALPYYRMRLEEVVEGKGRDKITMRPLSWYEGKGIKLVSARLEEILPEKKEVLLSDGSSLSYDKLVLTLGSKARRFPIPGREKGIYALRKMEDAEAIRAFMLATPGPVVVIGGGLLGLEAAASIARAFSVKVTALETADHILPRQLDKERSLYLKGKLLEAGVEVRTGSSAVSGDDESLTLSTGERIEAKLVIFSIGVIPEVEAARKAGLETGRGIVVDSHMRTSDEDIYAAGDCAEHKGVCTGLVAPSNAMGQTAAKDIQGIAAEYVPAAPVTQLKVAGVDIISMGSIASEPHEEAYGNGKIVKFVRDGIIEGIILIDNKKALRQAQSLLGTAF